MQINLRSDSVEISGYVNAVERNSKPLISRIGRFVERIRKGAFSRALSHSDEVYLLLNHNKNRVLGSTKQGNLELSEDSIGLHARAVVTDPEVIESARRGDLVGWSFGFYDTPDGVESGIDEETKLPLRKLRDLDLREVSILDRSKSPAYEGTLIMARADEDEIYLGETFIDDIETRSEKVIDLSPYYSMVDEMYNNLIEKRFNPNHDSKGRFTTGSGGGGSALGGVKKMPVEMPNLNPDQIVNLSMADRAKYAKQGSEWVADNLSVRPKPFKKESEVKMDKVMERGGINQEDAERCVELAEEVYAKASKSEPAITRDVVASTVDAGGEMFGLDYRLKQTTSMAGKIASDAKDDKVSYEVASAKINDAIRYTSILSEDKFTDGYNKIKTSLEEKGYVEVKCKNFYNMYAVGNSYTNGGSDQKAVQCQYRAPDGHMFELQFHTTSSAGVKECLNHPCYNQSRNKGIPDEEKIALVTAMRLNGEFVENPIGVETIPSHK